MYAADPERSAATACAAAFVRAHPLCAFLSRRSPGIPRLNMGQSKGQAASLEQQLLGMQARQPPPPKGPQAPQKGLPRLERMDTSDSLTEMDTRNSLTVPEKPLSGHPESSKFRSKSKKSVAAPPPPPLASSAKGGVKPVDVPPRARKTRTVTPSAATHSTPVGTETVPTLRPVK